MSAPPFLKSPRAVYTRCDPLGGCFKDLYDLSPGMRQPLSAFAHAARGTIEDDVVRQHASLDW